MTNIFRRGFLQTVAMGVGGLAVSSISQSNPLNAVEGVETGKSIPIVLHQTDLFHPHGDPDDHFDLATLYALYYTHRIDLRGIILDYPPDFRKGDPGVIPVAQMNWMCGKTVPTVIGANKKMSKRGDPMINLAPQETAAVDFIIKTLKEAETPVRMTCVGSATDIAIASLREPELFRKKCAGVYLDSGATHDNAQKPGGLEFNVKLNPLGYATLFDLPCPLYWYPCWHTVELRESGPDGTFYWLDHRKAFENISDSLRHFFQFMFEQSGDMNWLRYFHKESNKESWQKILDGKRGMWSTASILHLANLAVTRSGEVVPVDSIAVKDRLYQMTPVQVSCDDLGRTTWNRSDNPGNRWLFQILDPKKYPDAMAIGINSLFKVC